MQFRNDIQGLRGIAFLLVFIFHLNPHWLPGGFIGVDLFFVISGYLITTIILKKIDKNTFKFLEFYEGRLKRIAPAYYFLLLAISITGIFIYLPFDLKVLAKSIVYSASFIPNIMFSKGDSYFGAGLSENPLLHTWSLGIEMQFYFLLPLLLIYIPKKHLLNSLIFFTIIISAYIQYDLIHNGLTSSIYFSLLGRIPEFLIGSILSVAFKDGQLNNKKYGNILAISGIFILGLSLIFINENSLFPGFIALIPCLGIGCILISSENLITKFLANKPLVYIGTLSYSLYLWHWPIMAFIRYKNGVQEGYSFTFNEIVFIILTTSVCAYISYQFVEKTYRSLTFKKFFYYLSPAITILIAITASYLWLAKFYEIPKEYIGASFGTKSHNQNFVDTIGSQTDKNPSIFLFGDSHAYVIKPMFNYIGSKNNFSIKTLTTDSFPALEGINKTDVPQGALNFYENSKKFIEKTDSLIKSSKIVILSTNGLDKYKSLPNAISKLASRLNTDQTLILVNTFPIINKILFVRIKVFLKLRILALIKSIEQEINK